MKDRPIIFSAPMIRALLAGRKTQTRRVLKPQPPANRILRAHGHWLWTSCDGDSGDARVLYAPGDRLWVREAWAPLTVLTHNDPGAQALWDRGFYRADGSTVDGEISRWRSPVHMPRWASRLTLIVTDVRVQRLQDISEADAVAEGIERLKSGRGFYDPTASKAAVRFGEWTSTARQGFSRLWNSLHGLGAWDRNDWVAALTFTVHQCNIDQVGQE